MAVCRAGMPMPAAYRNTQPAAGMLCIPALQASPFGRSLLLPRFETRRACRDMPALQRAFTLTELLITIGLLAIVLMLLFIPITNSLGYFRTATARADAQTVARTAVDTMARELAEAMYVQLDMYDNSMIAFVPPMRLNPDDPNSEIVTPPRPDYSRAIRYWQALNDPTRNYTPGTHLEAGNLFFLARTVVPEPFRTDDRWNQWNDDWAAEQDAMRPTGVPDWPKNWAPIARLVHSDVDYRTWMPLGSRISARNRTLQPGYPYLMAIYNSYGTKLTPDQVRLYRSKVVGLSPNAPEYDVPRLSFTPLVVAGERMRPLDGPAGPDGTIYRARYSLWRQGTPYTGWSALASNPTLVAQLKQLRWDQWARDPFLMIYRYNTTLLGYADQPSAIGAFDPRTRTMKVLDLTTNLAYDTNDYATGAYDVVAYQQHLAKPGDPSLFRSLTASNSPWFGFSIDWIDGSLRFDFPAEPQLILGSSMGSLSAPLKGYEFALRDEWNTYTAASALTLFVVPDSVSVKLLDTSGNVVRVLRQVYCTPRERRDEFQLGLDPTILVNNPDQPRYGWIRLPDNLSAGFSTDTQTFQVDYRWRNNSVTAQDALTKEMVEHPDLITAYYRTAAIIDIGLTVSRADPSAPAGERIAQASYLTRRVKLHNLLREIPYAKQNQ